MVAMRACPVTASFVMPSQGRTKPKWKPDTATDLCEERSTAYCHVRGSSTRVHVRLSVQ
jgi:hypothetical protein